MTRAEFVQRLKRKYRRNKSKVGAEIWGTRLIFYNKAGVHYPDAAVFTTHYEGKCPLEFFTGTSAAVVAAQKQGLRLKTIQAVINASDYRTALTPGIRRLRDQMLAAV